MKKRYIFTLGAVVGGAAALFLTPKSGKEMQKDLLDKVESLQNQLTAFDSEEFKEKCATQLDEVKEAIANFDLSAPKTYVTQKMEEFNLWLAEVKEKLEMDALDELPPLALEDELEDATMLENLQELEDLEDVVALDGEEEFVSEEV